MLWVVRPTDARPVNSLVTLNSIHKKPQPYVRQKSPLPNDINFADTRRSQECDMIEISSLYSENQFWKPQLTLKNFLSVLLNFSLLQQLTDFKIHTDAFFCCGILLRVLTQWVVSLSRSFAAFFYLAYLKKETVKVPSFEFTKLKRTGLMIAINNVCTHNTWLLLHLEILS